jgi:hemolysin activation/secretion protein
MSFTPYKFFAGLALAGLSLFAHSQSAPDAGALRQQIEQQKEIRLPPAVRAQPVQPPPEIQPRGGLSVKVKAFRFAGNTLLSAEQLEPSVAEFKDRELGFDGLQRATDAVAAAYQRSGWITRVYLPEQDVSEGLITIQVVEARFSGVRMEGDPPKRVLPSEIEAFFRAAQGIGQPLNSLALDRALLLVDDLPGVSVAGTLAPGQTDGQTSLVLQSTDEPLFYGDAGLDNNGSRSTGSIRLTANLNINSPGQRGELMSINGLKTEGSDYARVALTVPDGHNGLRLSANMSAMAYKVIVGPAAGTPAQITGRSNSMGADLNYPIVRARTHNLYLSAGVENKSFLTRDTQLRSDYETYTLKVGLSGNRFDELGGGGANSASVQWLSGRLANMNAHSQIDTIGRNYTKLSYSLSRQQALVGSHSLLLSLQGQQASRVLDSSERFYVGGAQSVRAYPSSELGGERGELLTAEWRWRFNPAWVLTGFVDQGRVVALAPTTSDKQAQHFLRGHGLSASWQGGAGITTKLTWSRRDGSNPKPTLTGTDSDGTRKLDRLWLTMSASF